MREMAIHAQVMTTQTQTRRILHGRKRDQEAKWVKWIIYNHQVIYRQLQGARRLHVHAKAQGGTDTQKRGKEPRWEKVEMLETTTEELQEVSR